MQLPRGVRAVWDMDKAYAESSETRERICVNGLWRWQPAGDNVDAVPAGGWGYFKVPGSWPGIQDYMQKDSQTVHPHPGWGEMRLSGVSAAWYQREVTIPRQWAGRRITVRADWVNSHATVYVDGREAGAILFPGGELDITAACRPGQKQVLSMLVEAMPLNAVMMAYNDTAAAREVRGSVARRGLCGDVYLASSPIGARVGDVRVETSVRKWKITFNAALEDLAPEGRYRLRARIMDGGRSVAEFTGEPFAATGLKGGRTALTADWKPEKLWDVHTPQNQYEFSVSLVDAGGRTLDASLPQRFGFREFWIEGRDFYLNGTRIFISAVPIDNALLGAAKANYEAVAETLRRVKGFGINFMYTHNYGCTPGSHLSWEESLRAADDVGMLISFSQPHFGHYNWDADDAEETNGYARHAELYVRSAQNHPSVVAYSMSHNGTGYAEDMNPDMIDGTQAPRGPWSARNVGRALRAEAIVGRLDPSRIIYHHSSGDLSSMYTVNFYSNFAPIQEMSDWFEHWAAVGVKPAFLVEFGVPCSWDWTMYRGWYKGKRSFGSATVPWEYCVAEWNAQFYGDRAFEISEVEKRNVRWEAEQFRAGRLWHRWDYPRAVSFGEFREKHPIVAMYVSDNWRALRTCGLSGFGPWEYGEFWLPRPGVDRGRKELPTDWDDIQRPGLSPDYIEARYERMDIAFEPADWIATEAGEAVLRNNRPLLAYVAGGPEAFTSKGHNFLPGETVRKQLVVINNSRETVTCDCEWSLGLPKPSSGSTQITLPTGEQERLPLTFELPANLPAGQYTLAATVKFNNGETQNDSFDVDVLPPPEPVRAAGKTALFDPKGETAELLDAAGIRYEKVTADADLGAYGTLIIGKGALSPGGPAPDVGGVRDGLKVIVFEQTGEVLERRFGFRIAEYGLRWVFKRVPDHPLLDGLADEHLRNWRGEATVLPPRLDYELDSKWNMSPCTTWAGMSVPRVWRCGNRGNVASALIEKPASGDFLPILDGGYSLQYTPLVEYREGKGLVLFCQMDVTGRTESDPAAQTLARNIVRYVSGWQPAARRRAVYAGDAAGQKHLESTGLSLTRYRDGSLSSDRVLIVGPGGGKELAGDARAIADWIKARGNVLAIGLDADEVNAFLPLKVSTKSAEHIAACFEPSGVGSLLTGIGPADVHNREPRELPLVSAGATVVGDGVLATAPDGAVVFCQLAPWQFGYTGENRNVKRTFRRVSCLVTRLLANMGAAGETRLLAHISQPAKEGETRWLDGLYLDVPEEWDDPYRFFRW